MCRKRALWLLCGLLAIFSAWNAPCSAQDQDSSAEAQNVTVNSKSADNDHENSVNFSAVRNFEDDQKAIWTSPFHLKPADADWLLPLGAVAGGLFATGLRIQPVCIKAFSAKSIRGSSTFSNVFQSAI